MRDAWYILGEDGEPVGPVDHETFMKAGGYAIGRRRIALTELDGETRVSTVFLGLDHNFYDEDGPILYETMVFTSEDSDIDGLCERSRNRHAALAVHDRLVAECRAKASSHEGER